MNETALAPTVSRVRVAKTPAEEEAIQLFDEIRQLWEQYRREVPKKRRPWPESIRKRILALWALGISCNEIGETTGVPVMTLYSWRQRLRKTEPGFREIAVKPRRRTRFQLVQAESRRSSHLQLSQLECRPTTSVESSSTTVVLVLPGGARIEGLPIEAVARIARELSE